MCPRKHQRDINEEVKQAYEYINARQQLLSHMRTRGAQRAERRTMRERFREFRSGKPRLRVLEGALKFPRLKPSDFKPKSHKPRASAAFSSKTERPTSPRRSDAWKELPPPPGYYEPKPSAFQPAGHRPQPSPAFQKKTGKRRDPYNDPSLKARGVWE